MENSDLAPSGIKHGWQMSDKNRGLNRNSIKPSGRPSIAMFGQRVGTVIGSLGTYDGRTLMRFFYGIREIGMDFHQKIQRVPSGKLT